MVIEIESFGFIEILLNGPPLLNIFEFFHVVFILAKKGREIRKHFQTIIIFKVCSFHRGQDRWCVRLVFEGRVGLWRVRKSVYYTIVVLNQRWPNPTAIFRVSNWVSFHVRARDRIISTNKP